MSGTPLPGRPQGSPLLDANRLASIVLVGAGLAPALGGWGTQGVSLPER